MQHQLMPLSFEPTALEPQISAETLSYHHGKHHAGYVNKLNSLIPGTEYENMTLEQIIKSASGPIFNNAAQVFNHDFYWKGLSPNATSPSAELAELLERDFGSLYAFQEAFLTAAAGHFGSGWTWLVITPEGKLEIRTTPNADTPLRGNETPLLTCDVWEHAYYIDYRNGRPDYLAQWWERINWNFVSDNLASVTNDPIAGYNQPCIRNDEVCDYVDAMQENERTPS
ncbi:MAG: superoxide dismutase [Campylobacterales bacterium]|nr:superoxide dismutase [Campylobacterales bacterium]